MTSRAQWLDRVLPAWRTLALPGLTTVGLVSAYLVMRARVLPLLVSSDAHLGTDRPVYFSVVPGVWGFRLWAMQSADILAVLGVLVLLAGLFYSSRRRATARPALLRGMFNTVNVILVASVAFLISGAQSATRWGLTPYDNSYSAIHLRLAALGADARCDALTTILVHRLQQGELDTSEDYARALVRSLPMCERTYRDYGFAMAKAYQVTGHFALKSKNVKEAVQALEAAGDAPLSPTLTANGPGTVLASELLGAGERDAVLRYLEKMRVQWPKGRRLIDLWIRDVRRGRTPDYDFGRS